MKKIMIFAGTTEGRELCEKLSGCGFDCTVSVATEYGAALLPKADNITILQGRLDCGEMSDLFLQKKYDLVVDATHPFATEVSKEIRKACDRTKIRYLRLARNTDGTNDISTDSNLNGENCFSDISTAADWLESLSGKIFVSTGSKELPELCAKITDKSRLFVRVLPSVESLKICETCGILRSQIIAMQGPFSEKMNEIQFEESGAKILLTKESGKIGGYFEKIEAAKKLGMKIAVIENPEKAQHTPDNTVIQEKNACESEVFHTVGEICDIIRQLQ
ncbi:MAG: precorrin-6A reductase [Treponema sp.]|nr:precorrin-6A reductase [Treponema sp.]